MYQALMENFLFHCLFLAFIVPVILAGQKLLRRCLTAQYRHMTWYLYCFCALLFFLPVRLPGSADLCSFIISFMTNASRQAVQISPASAASGSAVQISDYAVSAGASVPGPVFTALFWIWAAGAAAMTAVFLYHCVRLNRLDRSMAFVKNMDTERLFLQCKEELGIRRNIRFVLSETTDTPMAFGIFFPVIVFPKKFLSVFSERELSYVFYHELSHYKRGDLAGSLICCIVRVLYWFHPFVLYSLKKMRTDREIACDASVLNHIRQQEWNSYGHTILNFAGYLSSGEIFSVSSGIGGSDSQLKQRITAIASYRRPSKKTKLAGFSLLLILWLLFSPFVQNHNLLADSVSGKPDRPFVSVDLSSFFPENEGCFVLYDKNKDQYSIYNEKMSRQRVSPDSTYKIYSALAALDAGVISPGKSEIAWDQKQYPFSSWNKDQTLDSAMSSSVNWYFQTLDKKLGKTELQKTLRRIRYGNEDISGGITSFWLESSLKISPLEQVILLRDFDQNRLGCSERSVRAVRNSIRLNSGPDSTLYGKTGTGSIDGHDINGWFIGILKTKDNTYCFALRIEGRDGASGKEAARTALEIIRSLSL